MISKDLYQAAHLLNTDSVVAIPTETVYGLAGNIYSKDAIQSIFKLKNRPLTNPLIIHIGENKQLEELTNEVPEMAQRLISKFWPGPLTLVLPKKETVPSYVTGGKDSVAVRMPNHEQTLKLLNLLPFPIAAPSANPYGSISPTSASHVDTYFKNAIPMILDGGVCQNGIESTIIGFENSAPVLYRLGSLSLEDIENEIGPVAIKTSLTGTPIAPGMMARHYAPNTLTIMVDDIMSAINIYKDKKIGLLAFNKKINNKIIIHQELLSVTGNLKEAAYNLYAAMHRLDALGLDIILTESFPNNRLGRAINDRLKRASTLYNI